LLRFDLATREKRSKRFICNAEDDDFPVLTTEWRVAPGVSMDGSFLVTVKASAALARMAAHVAEVRIKRVILEDTIFSTVIVVRVKDFGRWYEKSNVVSL
jgi:hypothetical protein